MKTLELILKAIGIFILAIGLRRMLGDIASHTDISANSSHVFGFGLSVYTCSIFIKALIQD